FPSLFDDLFQFRHGGCNLLEAVFCDYVGVFVSESAYLWVVDTWFNCADCTLLESFLGSRNEEWGFLILKAYSMSSMMWEHSCVAGAINFLRNGVVYILTCCTGSEK